MSDSYSNKRADARALYPPQTGEAYVRFYESGATPCGCITGVFVGVPHTSVAWQQVGERYHLRCCRCNMGWSRAVLDPKAGCLMLDASHPEEREARRRRLV